MEVFGSEAHAALAEGGFPGIGEGLWCGEGVSLAEVRRGWDRVAIFPAEELVDLLNLDDLFGGREDEGGQTGPGVLAEEVEAGVVSGCSLEWWVGGECVDCVFEVEIKLEIVYEPGPVVLRDGSLCVDAVIGLGEADPLIAYDSGPGMVFKAGPAEGLSGVESG